MVYDYALFINLKKIPEILYLQKNENCIFQNMTQQIGPIISALPVAFSTAKDVFISVKDYIESSEKTRQELQDWNTIVVNKNYINIPILELISIRNHNINKMPIEFSPGVCGWVNLMHVLGYNGIDGLHVDIYKMIQLYDGRYINKVNGHLATYMQHSAIIELAAKYGGINDWLSEDFHLNTRYATTLGTFIIGLNNSGSTIVYFNRGKGDKLYELFK